MAKVTPRTITPAVLAASRAVLNEQQLENGVAVIDLGGATTSIAVFEEGDLQYVAVIPLGGSNISNDLAIGLKTDPEIAEKVKVGHAVAVPRTSSEEITIKHDKETYTFNTDEIDEIVEARLEEIFDAVQKELKKAGRAGQLPSGVVLTGGTANLKAISMYAKEKLNLAARVGKSAGYGGVAENIDQPEFSTAVGLMLADVHGVSHSVGRSEAKVNSKAAIKNATGMVSRFLDRFKA
jgi:cell division protein FtsA